VSEQEAFAVFEKVIHEELDGSTTTTQSAIDILRVCTGLANMLIAKNKAYGDSALKPLRVFSKADAVEQIKVRMDDKLSRIMRGEAAGEDALFDLVGYWVLLQVAERRQHHTERAFQDGFCVEWGEREEQDGSTTR